MDQLISKISFILVLFIFALSCSNENTANMNNQQTQTRKDVTAKDILGNPDYLAISFGGYRKNTRDIQPTVKELKEDMRILAAMNIKVLRTYNTHLAHAKNVVKAIHELKEEDSAFEMYVMLGAWINCENAFSDQTPNHDKEDEVANAAEIKRAVDLANQYPDIIKVIAVGNEAMVKWAASYFVQADVILKWVNHLKNLRANDQLPKDLWITSSDNFASWGGGEDIYHTPTLTELIKAVDFVSLHTYPMHDTHYNPAFWGNTDEEVNLDKKAKIAKAMERARDYAKSQYQNTKAYFKSLGIEKSIHIGETGWATASNGLYGTGASNATDEYKSGLYYKLMREWTNKEGISCFYFEAFDENWKDAQNPGGSENYFGLFDINGNAKYAVWDLFDQGTFKGVKRGDDEMTKTYGGELDSLLNEVALPPVKEVASF